MLRYTSFKPETHITLQGIPFTDYREESQMPRIDDRYLDCSAYLYPTSHDAERGERIGGTGFMVAIPAASPWLIEGKCPKADYHHCYVVSNRHVASKHPVVRLNTNDGRTDVLPLTVEDWTFSEEHDLATVQIEYNKAFKYLFISVDLFLTKKLAAQEDIGIGDEVFMIGRFVANDGRQKNSPSLRWGHISTMPGEPVYHSSNKSGQQESFLVEIHSISGYSGSPVFVRPLPTKKHWMDFPTNTVVTGSFGMPSVGPSLNQGPWLLGVEWGYITTHDQRANNTGISGVVPAWHLLDLLNSEKLVGLRKEEQRVLAERTKLGGSAPAVGR